MSGMPVESSVDVYNENDINTSKEIDKYLENLGFKKDFTGVVNRIPEVWKQSDLFNDDALVNLYNTDKNEFNKRTRNIIWRQSLSDAMNEAGNEILKNKDLTPEEKDAKIANITEQGDLQNQEEANYGGDLKNKQYFVGQAVNRIKNFITNPEKQKQALEDLAISSADAFGSLEELEENAKTPKSKNLNEYQSVALNYLEQIDPEKFSFYKKYLSTDPDKLKEFEYKGYEQLQKELEEIGLNLFLDNSKTRLNQFSEMAKQQDGQLDPEDYQEYSKLLESANLADARLSKLGLLYPNAKDLDTRSIAQELTGGGSSTLGLAGKNLGYGLVGRLGKSAFDLAASPFRSEQENDNAALEALGLETYIESKTIPTRNQSALVRDLPKITPELDARIKSIKDDKNLSEDEKVDQVDQILQSNRDKWTPASMETKWNLGPTAIISSVANTGAKLAPFLAMEFLTQGSATPSVLASFAKMPKQTAS